MADVKLETGGPAVYARHGAALGIRTARKLLAIEDPSARARMRTASVMAMEAAAVELLRAGASQGEADLYLGSFMRAMKTQLLHPSARVEVQVLA